MDRVRVLIAGGGPVGLTLALELGRRGVRCMVLNDRPHTARHPKANAISARSMEHFRRLGVAERLRQAGLNDDHPTDVAYFTRLTGYELARLDMPSRREALRQARDGDGPWATPEPPHRCSQIYLERHLAAHAADCPAIDLRFGWRLESFREEADRVAGEAVEVGTGRPLAVEADYLVGCDGPHSVVRKRMGIEYEGESGVVRPFMGGAMYAAYVRARVDPRWLRVGRAWQYWVLNPDIRALLVPVDNRDRFVLLTNMRTGESGRAVDPARLLAAMAGAAFPVELLSDQPWTAGYSLVAQSYGRGRVLLAGDSAHLFTPTGGLGMNTGVDDAVNLGWKLAAACRGWAGPGLLASYQAERRPNGLRNVAFAKSFADSVGRMPVAGDLEADDDAGRARRKALGAKLREHAFREFIIPGVVLGLRYSDSPAVSYDGFDPPPADPNAYAQIAAAGGRAPHAWLDDGAALYDRLGGGFTLLRLGGTKADSAALLAAARERRTPLAPLDIADPALRELYGTDLVLIRPDQHIAWRGDAAPSDCLGLIDRLRGA